MGQSFFNAVSSPIMFLLTAVALLASGCLGELILPQGHLMAGRMPYTSPFFYHNYNGMINHNLLRSSPHFGMVNTLPFRSGHPIAPTIGHIVGHPFHALPPQPYTSVHNMVPFATAVHDPTYVSKNGEVEHVVKGIHAETAIKNTHGVTKREAEPMEVKMDGVHANTMPIMTGIVSPAMGHSSFPMTYGTGIANMPLMSQDHIAPPLTHMPCGPSGCVAHNIAPTLTHSMLHPFHTSQPLMRTFAPNTHFGTILSHSGFHGFNGGFRRIATNMF